MTTARAVISGALTFHLNRLSPGETLDADLAAVCLEALNHIADEMSGGGSMLFREILTPGVVTGASGTLGTTWALSPGEQILGATVAYPGGSDYTMVPLTMEQYAEITVKTTPGLPRNYAHDGASTVYLWPAASGQTITLRTKQDVSDFADLDTDYVMPKGYKSALSAMLAEKMAPTLAPEMLALAVAKAKSARMRLQGQNVNPAIIGGTPVRGNILSGWS